MTTLRGLFLPAACAALTAALSCACSPSAWADISTGLLHHWPLDETSGLIAHDVAGSNDATLSGFPDGQTSWTSGKIGGSLNFVTASNYVITDEPIVSSQYTIAFWLKVNGPGGINPRLVGPRDGEESWVVISAFFNKGVGFYYNHGRNLIQDPNPPATGEWEHYATTIDLTAHTAAVYRNGLQVAGGVFNDDVPLLPWVFGHNQGPSNTNDTLNGQLDDIRIYNRVLSQGDILELVPEPGGLALAAAGMLGLLLFARTRRMVGIAGTRATAPRGV